MPANPHDLLLEIGVEELPARFCAPALEQLKARATAALAAARLAHGEIGTLGTPRRLALLVDLIYALEFPQSMRWGSHSMRFARPIRWLLCLLGDRVVPFEVEGIATARETRGHRALAPGPLPVPSVHNYAGTCAQAYVMVDPAQRRDVIWQQVQSAVAELGGYVPRHDA